MTQPIPSERLAEIQARCDQATPGPWGFESDVRYRGKRQQPFGVVYFVHDTDEEGRALFSTTDAANPNGENDLLFAATARRALPDALAEIRRLRRELTMANAVVSAGATAVRAIEWSGECDCGIEDPDEEVPVVCNGHCPHCLDAEHIGHDSQCPVGRFIFFLEDEEAQP